MQRDEHGAHTDGGCSVVRETLKQFYHGDGVDLERNLVGNAAERGELLRGRQELVIEVVLLRGGLAIVKWRNLYIVGFLSQLMFLVRALEGSVSGVPAASGAPCERDYSPPQALGRAGRRRRRR